MLLHEINHFRNEMCNEVHVYIKIRENMLNIEN